MKRSGSMAVWALIAALFSGPAIGHTHQPPARHLTVYGAIYSPNRFIEILGISPAPIRTRGSSRLLAVALAQVVGRTGDHLRWEAEGQLVQHDGVQTHSEVNGVFIARWTYFPWDRFLDTRFAFGQGLSYATREPELEPRLGEEDEETNRLLYYLLAEIELASPGARNWSAVIRVHHRSGVFGKFGGVEGGSNFIGAGVRYRF